MEELFKIFGYVLLALMALVLIRVIKGPTAIDRLICVNIIGTKSIVLLIFMGLIFKRLDMFVDIAIGYGLLNFIASIAASKFYIHNQTMHPKPATKVGDKS